MDKIRIKLLSDSCISSGEVYNSSIDQDVAYDAYGLPYIPAKRLKGCLRESALELRDLGFDIPIEEVFGINGNQQSAFVLENARLENYDECVRQLEQCQNPLYKNQQTVLRQYTYIRNQTAIDPVTGTAKETTLRATRVMKRGLVFEAVIDIPEKYRDIMKMCCQNVCFMGVNRTRGMGEVSLQLCGEKKEGQQAPSVENVKWEEGNNYQKLIYEIRLLSPMLLKSAAGGQTKTLTYIEGAKILGLVAQSLNKDGRYLDFMSEGKLICSNAYISQGARRYLPISSSVYYVKNNKDQLRDKTHTEAESIGNRKGEQLCQISDWYISSDTEKEVHKLTVETEIHYHHRRPEDKSIGRVAGGENSEEDGSFFQMESISDNQRFCGFITGTTNQLREIYQILTKKFIYHMGYSKNSEYGTCQIRVVGLEEPSADDGEEYNQFVVKLNAPTIVYNTNGMYATEESVLLKYIEQKLGQENKLEIQKRFLNYTMIGGYNTTWNLHKPVVYGFDKGTTLVLRTKDGTKIPVGILNQGFIGERCAEGYGEILVYPVSEQYERSVVEYTGNNPETEKTNVTSGTLITAIATDMAKEYIRSIARRQLQEGGVEPDWSKKHIRPIRITGEMNAVNANMILICKEQESLSGFWNSVDKRFKEKDNNELKEKKGKMAEQILDRQLKMSTLLNLAHEKYPEAQLEENEIYKLYVSTLLSSVKYKLRGIKKNEE